MSDPAVPIRAAIYARISREDEARILANQLENLRSYCRGHAFALEESDVFIEVASGSAEHQVRLNNLLSEASKQTRSFDLVVFSSLSRMTRGGIEAGLYVLHRLEIAGVGWHFIDQPILNYDSTTPALAKEIIFAVLAAIDKDYRERIRRATRNAYTSKKNLTPPGERVRWGRPPGSKDKRPRKSREKRGPSGPTSARSTPKIAPII
jgi:DNA invertase Pin-like site-specific DNA recombinase